MRGDHAHGNKYAARLQFTFPFAFPLPFLFICPLSGISDFANKGNGYAYLHYTPQLTLEVSTLGAGLQ